MLRSSIKPKRDKPRRDEGRIQHERMKPKAKRAATADEKRHLARVAAMPCLIPGCNNPANVHHVVSDGMKRLTRTHRRVVPLCEPHHQSGPAAVHRIGHARFTETFGLDLLQIADGMWEVSNG